MKINKITNGFVSQLFDTESGKFTSQEFVAGDEVEFENQYGESIDATKVFSDQEPYLSYDMVQPDVDIKSCCESIQEDLLALMDGLPNEAQNRACEIVLENFKKFGLK